MIEYIYVLGNCTTEIETNLCCLEKGKEKCPKQGIFRILNQKDGDKRLVWDAELIEQVNEAKKTFLRLLEKGFLAYAIDPNGSRRTKPMTEFDPLVEEVVFIPLPQVVGG